MLYGNSFTNPIIYNACNEEFRKSFRSYFKMLITPCVRLVCGNNVGWDERPEILDDLGTTLNRSRSVRRSSSRRDTMAFVNTRTNGEVPNRLQDSNNNGAGRKVSYADHIQNVVENNHTCTKHSDRTNHRCSIPYRKASVIQYVSVLWHRYSLL